MKKYPYNFQSQEEYDSYLHCLNKANPGDVAIIYTNAFGSPSTDITDYTIATVVVGRKYIDYPKNKYTNLLILGINNHNEEFLEIGVRHIKALEPGHMANAFIFGIWAHDFDVRIKQLIRKSITHS